MEWERVNMGLPLFSGANGTDYYFEFSDLNVSKFAINKAVVGNTADSANYNIGGNDVIINVGNDTVYTFSDFYWYSLDETWANAHADIRRMNNKSEMDKASRSRDLSTFNSRGYLFNESGFNAENGHISKAWLNCVAIDDGFNDVVNNKNSSKWYHTATFDYTVKYKLPAGKFNCDKLVGSYNGGSIDGKKANNSTPLYIKSGLYVSANLNNLNIL